MYANRCIKKYCYCQWSVSIIKIILRLISFKHKRILLRMRCVEKMLFPFLNKSKTFKTFRFVNFLFKEHLWKQPSLNRS